MNPWELPSLLELARLGPTGLKRDCEAILRRIREEVAELVKALRDGDLAAILEEAGDVRYYATIARANGCPPRAVFEALYRSHPGFRDWSSVLDVLRSRFPGMSDGDAMNAIRIAAQAKYYTRFVVNDRVKNRQAEHAAILAAVKAWWGEGEDG